MTFSTAHEGRFHTEGKARFWLQPVEHASMPADHPRLWYAQIFSIPSRCIGHPTRCGTYVATAESRPSADLALAAAEVFVAQMVEAINAA